MFGHAFKLWNSYEKESKNLPRNVLLQRIFLLWIFWVSPEPVSEFHHHLGLQCPEFHCISLGSFGVGLGQRQ